MEGRARARVLDVRSVVGAEGRRQPGRPNRRDWPGGPTLRCGIGAGEHDGTGCAEARDADRRGGGPELNEQAGGPRSATSSPRDCPDPPDRRARPRARGRSRSTSAGRLGAGKQGDPCFFFSRYGRGEVNRALGAVRWFRAKKPPAVIGDGIFVKATTGFASYAGQNMWAQGRTAGTPPDHEGWRCPNAAGLTHGCRSPSAARENRYASFAAPGRTRWPEARRGRRSARGRRKAHRLTHRKNLWRDRVRSKGSLSAAQMQRRRLCPAFAVGPEILLADEPTRRELGTRGANREHCDGSQLRAEGPGRRRHSWVVADHDTAVGTTAGRTGKAGAGTGAGHRLGGSPTRRPYELGRRGGRRACLRGSRGQNLSPYLAKLAFAFDLRCSGSGRVRSDRANAASGHTHRAGARCSRCTAAGPPSTSTVRAPRRRTRETTTRRHRPVDGGCVRRGHRVVSSADGHRN